MAHPSEFFKDVREVLSRPPDEDDKPVQILHLGQDGEVSNHETPEERRARMEDTIRFLQKTQDRWEQWERLYPDQITRTFSHFADGYYNGWSLSKTYGLLYIEPSSHARREAVVDSLTMKMVAAYRQALPAPWGYFGYHHCKCGAGSTDTDYFVQLEPEIVITNSLCIHYLVPPR